MPETPVDYRVRITASSTTVRESFKAVSQNLGRILQGTTVSVVAVYKGWLKIHWGNIDYEYAWIEERATERVDGPASPVELPRDVTDQEMLAAVRPCSFWCS